MFLDTISHTGSAPRRYRTRVRLPRPLLTALWLALAAGAYMIGPGLPCAAILLLVAFLAAMDLAIWLPQPSGMSFRMAENHARRTARRCGEPPEQAVLWGEAARLRLMSDPSLQQREEERGLLLSVCWMIGALMALTFPHLLGKDPTALAIIAAAAGCDFYRRLPFPRFPAQPRAEMLARLEVLEQQGIPAAPHLARSALPAWLVLAGWLSMFLVCLIFFPGRSGNVLFLSGCWAWAYANVLIDELLPRPHRLHRWLAARRARKASQPQSTESAPADTSEGAGSRWTGRILTTIWTLLLLVSFMQLAVSQAWAYGSLLTAMLLAALDLYNRLPGQSQSAPASRADS